MTNHQPMRTPSLSAFPEEEITAAREIYKELDANSDGMVSRMEILTALKGRQQTLKEAGKDDLVQMYSDLFVHFEQHDINIDDFISFPEFMKYFDVAKWKYRFDSGGTSG